MSDTTLQNAVFAAEVAATATTNQTVNLPVISDTSNGILVGTDAPAPRGAAQLLETNPLPPTPGKSYTEEDLARVRQQEKEKLYPQIDNLKADLLVLKQEREARLAEETAKVTQAEAEARAKAESEMDLRALLEKKEAEWSARLDEERAEREKALTLLDREKQFQALMDYRNNRLDEESENIIPELIDLVEGGTPEEIEQSIANLKGRSERILENAQAAMQNTRREMVGARVTSPTAGPMDTNLENNSFSAEQIAGMSFNDYVKNRSKLLGKSPGDRGMFS
jgi:hypothetical protein